jgi:hypothetical protein
MKKHKYFLALVFIIIISCKASSFQIDKNTESVEELLAKLNTNDTINLLDLSGRSLKEMPDLSKFKVRKLNISNNNLDSLIISYLPNYLVQLDASNNKIANPLNFVNVKNIKTLTKNNTSKCLKEVNLSNNKISVVTFYLYDTDIDRIVLSNNNLQKLNLYFRSKEISYLDVSNNPNFSNVVPFDPKKIHTIKYKNIAINEELKLIKKEIIYVPKY